MQQSAIAVMGSGPGLHSFGKKRVETAVQNRLSDELIVMTGSVRDDKGVTFAKLAQDYAVSLEVPTVWVKAHQNAESFTPDVHGDIEQLAIAVRVLKITRFRVVTERPHWLKVERLLRKRLPGIEIEFLDSGNPVTLRYWVKEIIAYAISFLPPKMYSKIIGIHHRRSISKKGGGS